MEEENEIEEGNRREEREKIKFRDLSGWLKTIIIVGVLMILLIIVAIGLMWTYTRDTRSITSGLAQGLYTQIICSQSDVIITNVTTNSTPNVFNVTLFRQNGDREIEGVKLVFIRNENSTDNTIVDISGNINYLQNITKSVTISSMGLSNPTEVTAAIYFIDNYWNIGNQMPCYASNPFEF